MEKAVPVNKNSNAATMNAAVINLNYKKSSKMPIKCGWHPCLP